MMWWFQAGLAGWFGFLLALIVGVAVGVLLYVAGRGGRASGHQP